MNKAEKFEMVAALAWGNEVCAYPTTRWSGRVALIYSPSGSSSWDCAHFSFCGLQAEQDSDGSAQSTADMTAFVSTNYYCAVLHLAVLIVECRLDHICRVEPTVHLWLMVYPCSLFSGAKPSYADGKFLVLFGDSLVSCACPHFFFWIWLPCSKPGSKLCRRTSFQRISSNHLPFYVFKIFSMQSNWHSNYFILASRNIEIISSVTAAFTIVCQFIIVWMIIVPNF